MVNICKRHTHINNRMNHNYAGMYNINNHHAYPYIVQYLCRLYLRQADYVRTTRPPAIEIVI